MSFSVNTSSEQSNSPASANVSWDNYYLGGGSHGALAVFPYRSKDTFTGNITVGPNGGITANSPFEAQQAKIFVDCWARGLGKVMGLKDQQAILERAWAKTVDSVSRTCVSSDKDIYLVNPVVTMEPFDRHGKFNLQLGYFLSQTAEDSALDTVCLHSVPVCEMPLTVSITKTYPAGALCDEEETITQVSTATQLFGDRERQQE